MPADTAQLLPAEVVRPSLADLGERRIVATVLAPNYADDPTFGDDCADLGRGLVVTTDACPAPMMRQLGEADPFHAGWLLATINLSDLAAAGAVPEGLVVSYTLPPETPVRDLEAIVKGVDECARSHGTRVVGGDIRDGREVHLSATAIGRTLPRSFLRGRRTGGKLSRRGAAAGDVLLLVGNPGYLWGAALLHRGHATLPERQRSAVFDLARRPVAQLRAARLLAARGLARAAMDVSDGLYATVKILAETNDLGAVMEPRLELDDVLLDVCRQAGVSSFQLGQNWGDWCLLVAVRAKHAEHATRLLRHHGIGVRRVGALTEQDKLLVGTAGGERPWNGHDQERFTATSWVGDGVDAHIARMRAESRAEG